MNSLLRILPASLLGAVAVLLTACNGVNYGPSAYFPPPAVVPGYGWIGPGYYGGIYYPSSVNYYGSSYYRSVSGTVYHSPYANAGVYHGAYNSGAYYDNARGGHGYSYDGTGAAYGARGGSASWSDGSGSATGYRGGTASWSNGSGTWHGAGGRSGSFHR